MKNYFLIFFTSYLTILFTKFIFAFYLNEQFSEFTFNEIIYAIFWGIKFDFAASAILAFVVSFFDFNKKLYAYIGSISIITIFLTQISDIFYFAESSRHIGYEILDIFQDAKSLLMTAYSQYTFITIISIFLSLIIFIVCYKFLKKINTSKINRYYFFKKLFIVVITIFFIRGMFQHIPLHPWQSNEIGNSQLASISLNSIYNIAYTLANKSKKLEPVSIPKIEKDIQKESILNIYNTNNKDIKTPILETKPNVVFFFLESWSGRYSSSYGFPKKITPNFDEILKKSIRTRAMVANGHRTTEGIFAVLTSLQNPLGNTVAKTQLQNYSYDSIIYLLNKQGYQSAFFQGTSKDTSGTGSLLSYLGFSESYGKRDVKKRIYEENYWGVQDRDLYNFITEKIDNKDIKEPFVLGINNASTHDTKLPKGEKSYDFSDDKGLNKKLNTIHYSDAELARFIEIIEQKYPNTIFVIFADHCGGSLKDNLDNYIIPFAIYSKKLITPKYYDFLATQRDIAPTIYDLILGTDKNETKNFTGSSIFRTNISHVDYFHNGILGWIENNDVIEINTANKEVNCYILNNITKNKIPCGQINEKRLLNNVLSYTNLSQKLLFKGETKEFYKYKIEK